MGISAGKALVNIEFDPADIARLEASAGSVGRKVAKDVDKATSRFSRFGSAVKTTGKYAALASIPIAGALVIGIRKSIEAASESEQAQLRLTHAVQKAGGAQKDSIAILAELQRKQFDVAISDEDLADAYSKIVTSTGKVQLSQKGLNAALDVAAARNISLNTAALAVGKALAGQTTSLQRLGIHLDANASKTEVLAALQERFGGAAVRQAAGTAGALQKVGLALDELEETAGKAFLPVIKSLGVWLSKTENQRKAQETLKTVMADAAAVGRVLGNVIAFTSRNWDTFKAAVQAATAPVRLMLRYNQALIGVLQEVYAAAKPIGGALRSAFSGVVGFVKGLIAPILAVVGALQSVADKAVAVKDAVAGVTHGTATVYTGSGGAHNPAHRAMGGPVMAGTPYTVGERGPEVFVPNVSGRIVPSGGLSMPTPIINITGPGLRDVIDVHIDWKLDGVSRMVRGGTLRPA